MARRRVEVGWISFGFLLHSMRGVGSLSFITQLAREGYFGVSVRLHACTVHFGCFSSLGLRRGVLDF